MGWCPGIQPIPLLWGEGQNNAMCLGHTLPLGLGLSVQCFVREQYSMLASNTPQSARPSETSARGVLCEGRGSGCGIMTADHPALEQDDRQPGRFVSTLLRY